MPTIIPPKQQASSSHAMLDDLHPLMLVFLGSAFVQEIVQHATEDDVDKGRLESVLLFMSVVFSQAVVNHPHGTLMTPPRDLLTVETRLQILKAADPGWSAPRDTEDVRD
ncbi:hypothetical protein B0H14DRAFT_3452558 [Mycena olivaceomarginata]|nr:hypothetical protein B0H14DRAFT_3452558 [Mycena olivaceomarginata]